MCTGVENFIETLTEVANAENIVLCLKTVTAVAIQTLNFSVKDFWTNYKCYMMAAYGKSRIHFEQFSVSKMGKIVDVYARMYGKEVHYAAIVRDVLMYTEQFFLSEYGVDVSNLSDLLCKFEDFESFSEDAFGKIVCDIIQGEQKSSGHGGKMNLKVTTFTVNEDVVEIKPVMMPKEVLARNIILENSPFTTQEEVTSPSPSIGKGTSNQFISTDPELKHQKLKVRADYLRQLRRVEKPLIDENNMFVVETDVFGNPNGRGYRELLHMLSCKARHTFPLGIGKTKELGKAFQLIIDATRKAFSGDWTNDWAKRKLNQVMRTRKYRIVSMVKCESKILTPDDEKYVKRMMKNPSFMEKSRRLTELKGKMEVDTHAGRGGFVQIKHRYNGKVKRSEPKNATNGCWAIAWPAAKEKRTIGGRQCCSKWREENVTLQRSLSSTIKLRGNYQCFSQGT